MVKDINHWNAWNNGEIPADWPLMGLANPGRSMLTADGPEHRRLRNFVAQALTVRRVQKLRPGIEALCARMLDTMEQAADENGVVDLKAHYAHPVPMTVITELFGMPSHHIPRLKELFDIFFSTVVPREQVPPMMAELDDIFQAFVQSKRDEPGDDLTSGLLEAAADGDTLTNEEIVNTLKIIVTAYHETTISLIVNAVRALSAHPEQRARVLVYEIPWSQVIEETLRYNTPTSHLLIRFPTEDIEVGDQILPKGEGLIVSFSAIGRDENQHGPTSRRVRRHPRPDPPHRLRPRPARLPRRLPLPRRGRGRPPGALRPLPRADPRGRRLRAAQQADPHPERPLRPPGPPPRLTGRVRAGTGPRPHRGPVHTPDTPSQSSDISPRRPPTG